MWWVIPLAAAAGVSNADARAQSAESCPELFEAVVPAAGDLEVVPGKKRYLVAHTGPWFRAPKEISFRDLSLVELHPEHEQVVVELERALGGCHPGLYTLEVGDAIGDGTRVLAILPNAVLLQANERLRFLAPEGRGVRPAWTLSWVSDWSATPYVSQRGSSARSRAKSRVNRRRKK